MLGAWANFFFAEVGASASLAGLLFVAISVSQARILEIPRMADRALEALVLLLLVLIVASLGLVPGQPLWLFGTEIVGLGLIALVIELLLQRVYLAATEERYRRNSRRMTWVSRIAAGLMVGAGIELLLRTDATGLYLLPAGIIVSFIAAMINAWVLLIEINR